MSIEQRQARLDEVLRDEGLRQKFSVIGMRTLGLGPEPFARFLQGETAKFGENIARIIKAA